MHGLGEQQAIEWIGMRRCYLDRAHGVLPCDREGKDAGIGKPVRESRDVDLQFA